MTASNECWVTTALTETQCFNALVLAQSLKRVMTSRKLLVLVSHSIPRELWDFLQKSFDVCIRLEEEPGNGKNMEIQAKLFCWSLIKWNKVVFLEPDCLVVKNSDELFKRKRFATLDSFDSKYLGIFVTKPSLNTWKTLMGISHEKNGSMGSGNGVLTKILGPGESLDEKYNVTVDLDKGSLIRNLDDINIVKFTPKLPLDVLCQHVKEKITGHFESALMDLWQNDWEQGLVKSLSKHSKFQCHSLATSGLYQDLPLNENITYSPTATDQYKESIAIIGISCRFPGANNLDEFWKLLIEGRDEITLCPEGRWTKEQCPNIPEESKTSLAGFLKCSLDEFDGKFFGMSPMELSFMDPQQRLALQVAWEALEDAGIDPVALKNTFTGVFGGAWKLDYHDILHDATKGDSDFLRTYLGNSFGVITARISHCLDLTGPSIATESGCSSSMVAVDMACKSLLRGETDLSLACGVNLLSKPFSKKSMDSVLSADGHCKTFDESADGFVRAEGVGVLVLKRYADAVKDGDRVWALIRGSAVVQEGASRSLGTPTKHCEALAMELALEAAGVEPKDVSFVEAHGTGTSVGDPLEVAAMSEVYSRGREDKLIIGSVKTNIGHTEACSGIAGIIKVVLSMKNELIPSHRNFKTLNPNINLEAVPATIPLEATEWKKDARGKPRIAGVSSFGITGTDTHAILQETPDLDIPPFSPQICAPRESHILTISAKTPEALEESLKNYKTFLEQSDKSLGDISHTVNVGRAHFPYRTAVVGSSVSDVLNKIQNVTKTQCPETKPRICFLFTGQGSQYPGMAKSLYDRNPIFKINFDICEAYLSKGYGISIKEALWGNNTGNISRTIYSQTSIFCVEYCLLKLWESWGIKPDYVLGHSLGEFAAAVATGTITFEDALKLVAERSRLIDGLPGGKMLVLKETHEAVDNLLTKYFKGSDNWLDYAAVNSPEQTVLAGSEENIRGFSEFCKNNKIKTHILEATHAFHSRHMDPILDEYRKIASTVKYSKPTCVYVSGMEGRVVEEENYVNAEYWVRHTRESVQFVNASKAILELGCSLFLEVGPQPVLSAMIMINSNEVSNIGQVTCLPSIRKQDEDWSTILTSLGKLYMNGMDVNWKRLDQFENLKKVTAPFYPFQSKTHWYDIPDQGPGAIHPLVGTSVPNASNLKIFNQNLVIKSAEFLRDHVIGSKIIFPGAGFMEMCLVAGHATTQCTESVYFDPTTPMTLDNFVIESPLGINDNEETELQVIVTSDDSGDTKVTIYSKLSLDKETQKWVRHASAIFSPSAVQTKEDNLSIKDSLTSILERCGEQVDINSTYKKLADCGLKFGPQFRSIRSMKKGKNEICFEVNATNDSDKYVCHPVVLDALLQAIMISLNPNIQKLHVPVSVTKLIWFAKIETEVCYIHCTIDSDSNDAVAVLYDENGQALAKMVGATFMETTVGTIMSSLEAQRLSMPSMFENVWKPQLGSMERRANLLERFPQALFEDEYVSNLNNEFNPLDDKDRLFLQKSNELCALYMTKCLYDLGWKVDVGKEYELQEIIAQFKVIRSLGGFLQYMLIELSKDGLFEIVNPDQGKMTFKLVQTPPSEEEILMRVEKLYAEVKSLSPSEIELVSVMGPKLSLYLTGKESALTVLFPEESTRVCADSFYMEAKLFQRLRLQSQAYYKDFFLNCSKVVGKTKGIIRILEVGAGTGSHTKTLLPFLKEFPEGYEYTYTDISPAFFMKGEKIFEDSKIRVLYRVFNIEEDAATQGFIPNHYDLIIGNNVIHATKSISGVIGNLRNLLRDNGIIMVSESIKPFRNTNILFGPLDGYWLFNDFDLRPYNCEINLKKWHQVLSSNNFEQVSSFSCFDDHMGLVVGRAKPLHKYIPAIGLPLASKNKAWIVFSEEKDTSSFFIERLKELGNRVVTVTNSTSKYNRLDDSSYSIQPEEEEDMVKLFESITKESRLIIEGVVFLWGLNYTCSDYAKIAKPYLSLCKALFTCNNRVKLFVITRGVSSVGDSEVSPPVPGLLWGMTQSFQNEKPESLCRCIDLDEIDTQTPTIDQLHEAFSELFIDDQEMFVSYRANQRNICRFTPWKVQNTSLSFPASERYRLVLSQNKTITDLRFGPVEKVPVFDTGIEIRVKAYALNFRDVFVVMKPEAEWDNFNTVGIDFAGIITAVGAKVTKHKVGDSVLGCNMRGDSLPSHLVTKEGMVINIPSKMTFNEAATLPVVASTAYLSLIQVAKLTKNDTILIHTASGGVGLVAIQIAKSVGATIVATAGSKRKRAYLKSIGIKHIYHSRNTNYEHEIRKTLNGKGVDVVLNSLTSPGFKEASLSICNEGARFIEMSKLNTWTPEEVKVLRPDVKYDIVDLSAASDDEMKDLMVHVQRVLNDSVIKPISYVRFDASEIREALTYLQKAKHIGKIVCEMPDPDMESFSSSAASTIPMFNDRSTYLITGGLGGIGFEVAKWMLRSGAKNIALVGRSPPSDKVAEDIREVNGKGKNVFALQFDIGHFDQCKELLDVLKSEQMNLPPLRGIMHAAGVLSDAVYTNQTWEKFQKTYNPKVNGGWNLHELTLDYPLEHFVMFSSIVACVGSLGQSNHSSANFFLDALTFYRNSIGLPATTVNWGHWGQVGVAANIEVVGFRPFTALQGISALEKIMKSQKLQACVSEADYNTVRQIFPATKRYMEELKTNELEQAKDIVMNNDKFWTDYDEGSDTNEKLEVMKVFVRSVIRQILKLDKDELLKDDENFQDLGMDSLMMIEMKNMLQVNLESRTKITANSIKDCHTVNELANKINLLVSGDLKESSITREQLIKLIREDSELPASIQPASLTYCKPSEIKTILVTGATGNLGPYILREILKINHITKVYCLVRGDKTSSPDERLKKILLGKGLLEQIPIEKVECVNGSITQAKLGLSDEKFMELSKTIDAVVHLAVKSNLIDGYSNTDKSDSSMRTVNVKGTLNVLEFVCSQKTKTLFHASSIIANGKLDEDLSLSESWPTPEEFDDKPDIGYPISKFICDRFMAQAVERGLPVKVFRFPVVGGDSKTGANVDYENNQMMLRLMSYIQMGLMPKTPFPFFILPVDTCSDLAVRLFFNDETPHEIYNIYNPTPCFETDLTSLGGEMGFKIELVELEEYQRNIESKDNSMLVHFFKTMSMDENKDNVDRIFKNTAIVQGWIKNPERAFVSKKLTKLVPEYPNGIENCLLVIKRDLMFAKESGVFKKFGI